MSGKTVYFIKPVGMNGPIKIGCSSSPAERRIALDTWSPFALEIIAQISGDYEIERRFHALFQKHHQRREWFNWAPEFDQVVASINAGTFDISKLPEPITISGRVNNTKRNRPAWFGRQQSFILRCAHMLRRTGYTCPVKEHDIVQKGDALAMSLVEAYLANPLKHGKLIDQPWARERAAQFQERAKC